MAERRTKYGNAQTVHQGVVYASRLEAECARVLDLLHKQGRILEYARQVPYELAPARSGRRAVRYVCDFVVWTYDDRRARRRTILLEAKGYSTRVGQLKIRWLLEKYADLSVHVVRAPQEVIAVVDELEHAKEHM